MDVQTIDQQYQQLQSQSQQTVQALQTLGGKLQAASQGGDPQAREWFLDLRELAMALKAEQDQVANLLQAMHGFIANAAQQQPAQYASPPAQDFAAQQMPQYAQQAPQYAPQSAPQQSGGGGFLGNFLGSGIGRALETGAAFGIGDELIQKIF